MNLFGFTPKAFEQFNLSWDDFKKTSISEPKKECLLPVSATEIIRQGKGKIKFFTSSETWFGMTYPEDRALVKQEIANKIKSGYYPDILWNQ